MPCCFKMWAITTLHNLLLIVVLSNICLFANPPDLFQPSIQRTLSGMWPTVATCLTFLWYVLWVWNSLRPPFSYIQEISTSSFFILSINVLFVSITHLCCLCALYMVFSYFWTTYLLSRVSSSHLWGNCPAFRIDIT